MALEAINTLKVETGNILFTNDMHVAKDKAVMKTLQTEEKDVQQKEAREKTREKLEVLGKEIGIVRNVGLKFSVHDATDKTIIRVIDKETDDLIMEIPPEEFLDLAAKMEEMIGILFDKKV